MSTIPGLQTLTGSVQETKSQTVYPLNFYNRPNPRIDFRTGPFLVEGSSTLRTFLKSRNFRNQPPRIKDRQIIGHRWKSRNGTPRGVILFNEVVSVIPSLRQSLRLQCQNTSDYYFNCKVMEDNQPSFSESVGCEVSSPNLSRTYGPSSLVTPGRISGGQCF